MNVIAANGWDIASYTFGVICLVGPFFLVVWWWRTVSHRVRNLGKEPGAETVDS
jgi:hypothetical protein